MLIAEGFVRVQSGCESALLSVHTFRLPRLPRSFDLELFRARSYATA